MNDAIKSNSWNFKINAFFVYDDKFAQNFLNMLALKQKPMLDCSEWVWH